MCHNTENYTIRSTTSTYQYVVWAFATGAWLHNSITKAGCGFRKVVTPPQPQLKVNDLQAKADSPLRMFCVIFSTRPFFYFLLLTSTLLHPTCPPMTPPHNHLWGLEAEASGDCGNPANQRRIPTWIETVWPNGGQENRLAFRLSLGWLDHLGIFTS